MPTHRTDPRLRTITKTIEGLIPAAAPELLSVDVIETLPGPVERSNTWSGRPAALAERIFTALYGHPATGEELSPVAQAEDAKRARDIDGEISALQRGHTALTSAPWYPSRPGDLVHVHYEAGGLSEAFGETYLVTLGKGGFLSMQLLCHSLPDGEDVQGMVGCFAADDDPDPLMELWMEAGPHRLTVIRDGRPVHTGGA